MHKNNHKFKSVVAFSILAFGISALSLSGSTPVQAEYKADISRYDNVLSSAAPEATYNYSYENTSSGTAPGYFELSLENLTGTKATDLLDIKSITETLPIDYATKKPVEGAKTTEFKVSEAVYKDGDTLKIRISPQSACKVRPEGGCADGMIPAAIPAKISIKVALKTSAPTTATVLFGSGRLFFPSGFDANQIGWKINVGDADESSVVLPTNPDIAIDAAALETNQALVKAQTTEPKIVAPTEIPAVFEVGKDAPAKTAALNTQNLSSEKQAADTSSDTNLALVVSLVAGVSILAGAGFYTLNMQKKNAKIK